MRRGRRTRRDETRLACIALAAVVEGCTSVGGLASGGGSDAGGEVDSSRTDVSDAAAPVTDAAALDPSTPDVVDAGVDAIEAGPDASDAGGPRRVFVTSKAYTGNLLGLSGADELCKAHATAARLGGAYKAWLSDSVTSAAARLSHANAPYVLVDGVKVADDWAGLTRGQLLHAIDKTESGGAPPTTTATTPCQAVGQSLVWTGSQNDGTMVAGGYFCGDWNSENATSGGAVGSAATTVSWSGLCAGPICSYTAALYCVEQ